MKNISKEINFVPDFMVKRKRQKRRYYTISLVTFIVVLVCFSIYFIPNLNAYILSNKLENINIEIKAFSEAKDLNNKLISLQTNIENKEAKFKEITKDDIDIVYLITKVKSAIPANAIMTGINIKNRSNITISYSIENPLTVANLVNNLRALNIFESVEMPNIPIADNKMDCTFNLQLKSGAATREGLVIPDIAPIVAIPQVPAQNTNTADTSKPTGIAETKTQTPAGTTSKTPTKKPPAKATTKTTKPSATTKTTTPSTTTTKTTTPSTTTKTNTSTTKPSSGSTSKTTKTTTGTSTTQKTN